MLDRRIAPVQTNIARFEREKRLKERREDHRWKATSPLTVIYHTEDQKKKAGLLEDVSLRGISFRTPGLSKEILEGQRVRMEILVKFAIIAFEGIIARVDGDLVGIRLDRPFKDARFADIVDEARAYSIYYQDGKVFFAGDLDNPEASSHLLKCINTGAIVDLSRARGSENAADVLCEIRNKGAMLRRCSARLDEAIEEAGRSVCAGCVCGT